MSYFDSKHENKSASRWSQYRSILTDLAKDRRGKTRRDEARATETRQLRSQARTAEKRNEA